MTIENPFDQTRKFQFINKINKLKPLGNTVLATDMNFGERFTNSGIVLLGDDGKASGIRPRWCKVYAIGPEQKDVEVGQWIYVAHGRWSRGVEVETDTGTFTLRKIDPKDIMAVSDQLPNDETISNALTGA